MPSRADEGSEKVFFPGPHPPSSTVPPLPEGEGSFRGVDSATSPSASRRMTGGGRHPVKMEGIRIRETNRKEESGVMGIGFLLMPGTLFFLISFLQIDQLC